MSREKLELNSLFPDIKPKKLKKDEISEHVKKAKEGSEQSYEALLSHLHNYLCYLTNEFFIQGSEPKDVYQEGAIKLLNVIEKYDENKGSFVYFAQSSIRKHIITSINKEQAKKRSVLNNSFSLDDETKNKDGEKIVFIDTISSDNSPISSSHEFEFSIIQKDYEEYLIEEISQVLSPMEHKVFVLRFIEGYSYKEIAKKLSTREKKYNQKSVDNAIWRSRPKIKKVLEKLDISPSAFDLDSSGKKGK